MRILAIGAHPDDLEYGCGGALLRHVQRGDQVHLAIVTDGGQGGDPEVRRQEQLEAARILGAVDVRFMAYPDTRFECNRETIAAIEGIVRGVDPGIVYTHYADDTHQDHRQVARAVVPAVRSVPSLLHFEGLSSNGFSPSVFVNVGRVVHQKLAALEAHVSQVARTNIEGMSILDVSRAATSFRGIQGRVRHAEGFVPNRYFIDL
jgi:LmbE family N-acetylglucosaminyl deacetylase